MNLRFVLLVALATGVSLLAQDDPGEKRGKAIALQARGVAQFKAGNFAEAIKHWDEVIKLYPEREPHHWQRGIAYYYAGEYEKGRRQFEMHQTVNGNDVENAVWHFLCVARASGLETAKQTLIPIEGDTRVPMMKVHGLFAGKSSVEDVLAAAKAGSPSEEELKSRLFYTHLYLGLYEDIRGNSRQAREHIGKAVGEYAQPHYMGDVARVHWKLLQEQK